MPIFKTDNPEQWEVEYKEEHNPYTLCATPLSFAQMYSKVADVKA